MPTSLRPGDFGQRGSIFLPTRKPSQMASNDMPEVCIRAGFRRPAVRGLILAVGSWERWSTRTKVRGPDPHLVSASHEAHPAP